LAAEGLTEPFIVLNGDTYFEVNLDQLRGFHSHNLSELTLSVLPNQDDNRYMKLDVGVDKKIKLLDSRIGKIHCLANGGVYMMNPSVLNRTKFRSGDKLSLETDLIPALIVQGAALYGFESCGGFIDIGVPDDYFRATKMKMFSNMTVEFIDAHRTTR